MFRKNKNQKKQEGDGSDRSQPGNQADALSEKLKGFNPPAAWDVDAVAEAERAAAKSNAAKGDDTDRILKAMG